MTSRVGLTPTHITHIRKINQESRHPRAGEAEGLNSNSDQKRQPFIAPGTVLQAGARLFLGYSFENEK